MIAALVLLWPALRWLGVGSVAELELSKNSHATRDVVAGLALALVPLAMLALGYFGFDVYQLRKGVDWHKMAAILGATIAVPIVEEALFRGVLLGISVKSIGRWAGAIVVSLLFAIVHFIRQRGEIAEVHWWSGFALLGSVLPGPGEYAETFAGAGNLFVIGLILASARLRTRSLWLPIGLHAGWILGQQVINLVGRYHVKPADAHLPWVGPNVVSGMVPTGIVPLAALLVTGACVWWYLSRAASIASPRLPGGAG
jgi:membrane protease YdiL (CAAX protease family)